MVAIKDISERNSVCGPMIESGYSDALFPLPHYEVIDGRAVFRWDDQITDAVGWIVIDHPRPTVSGGGLFMHSLATLQEVTDVASTMSYKLCVGSEPHVVGAKGGIRFDHRRLEAPAVLERFVRDNVGVISQYWGTGGDLNTSHSTIDTHIRRYTGLACALAPIARALSNPLPMETLLSVLKAPVQLTGVSVTLEEASVGFGAAIAFLELLKRTAPQRIGTCRIALQGFGTVGTTFAHYVCALGIGSVVGISSQHGFLVDAAGIDVATICRTRKARAAEDPSVDPKLLETGLTHHDERYTMRRPASSDAEHLCAFLANARANTFAPCAGRYVLSAAVLDTLAGSTFADDEPGERFVVAGANNIFDTTQDLDAWLADVDMTGVRMLPEWVTNAGTSNIFMRTCAGNFELEEPGALLEAAGRDIERFLTAVERCVQGEMTSKALFNACYKAAAAARTSRSQVRDGKTVPDEGCLTSLIL